MVRLYDKNLHWFNNSERVYCVICEHVDEPHSKLLVFDEDLPICSFCAVYFLKDEPLPDEPEFDSDMEFMGAWSFFVDELIDYQLNVMAEWRTMRYRAEGMMLDALKLWANGSMLSDGAQMKVVQYNWACLSFERIFSRLDSMISFAETYSHLWEPQRIREELRKSEIITPWRLWVKANIDSRVGRRNWMTQAAHHYADCERVKIG